MPRPLVAAVAALVLGAPAVAQTTRTPTTRQVELLAPQLVPFSGSTRNFESLVLGLTTAAPVRLATVSADGTLQSVNFTPGSPLSTTDAARVLEAARQSLISRGIASPTAQQLAASLMGGPVASPSGTSAITGVITGTASSPTPVTVRTDTHGTLQLTNGGSVPLQGVLQGRLRNTSDSSGVFTSASPTLNTSASPTVNTSDSRTGNTSDSRTGNTSDSRTVNTSASPGVGAALAPRGARAVPRLGAR